MSRVRVLVADDSSLCRAVLRELLEAEGDIEVVGEATDGAHAVDEVQRLRPQLVTLDIEMPRMDGLSAIRHIMAKHPVPILVVTGRPADQRDSTLFEAVRRGALDLVPKPSAGRAEDARSLRTMVRRLASVAVVRHVAVRSMRPLPALPALGPRQKTQVIGIGASAGGPAAVATVLRGLPKNLPACVALVQHVLPGFVRPFAEFLRNHSSLDILVVEKEVPARPGTVLVAPDGRHLVAIAEGRFAPSDAPPWCGHRPAVNVLFRSLARVYGRSAAGVVLSGIGDDGTEGLREMALAGGLTIAQDQETCTVYGMPRAAIESGAARCVVALGTIAVFLTGACGGSPPTTVVTK